MILDIAAKYRSVLLQHDNKIHYVHAAIPAISIRNFVWFLFDLYVSLLSYDSICAQYLCS